MIETSPSGPPGIVWTRPRQGRGDVPSLRAVELGAGNLQRQCVERRTVLSSERVGECLRGKFQDHGRNRRGTQVCCADYNALLAVGAASTHDLPRCYRSTTMWLLLDRGLVEPVLEPDLAELRPIERDERVLARHRAEVRRLRIGDHLTRIVARTWMPSTSKQFGSLGRTILVSTGSSAAD